MIQYEPGKWSVLFALQLEGSVLPKASVWAFSCSMLSVLGHFIFQFYGFNEDAEVASSTLSVLGGFGFILGFLVVFRSQQAYSRWWEGGTLLQQLRGEWFNAFSALMAFCNEAPEFAPEVHKFRHRLARLMSLLYSSALQQVTTTEGAVFELIDLEGFDIESMNFLDHTHDRCEVVLQWIQRLIVEANEKEIIKVAPPILSRVYNQLGNGIVNLNNARKITDFPIPFPLAQMLTIMLICHWGIVAFLCAFAVRKFYVAAALSFIVEMSFWSVNYIAVELEMPFGDDPNDLPLQDMQQDLNKSLKALLHPMALTHPHFLLTPRNDELIVCELNFDEYVSAHQVPVSLSLSGDKRAKAKKKSSKPGRPSNEMSPDLKGAAGLDVMVVGASSPSVGLGIIREQDQELETSNSLVGPELPIPKAGDEMLLETSRVMEPLLENTGEDFAEVDRSSFATRIDLNNASLGSDTGEQKLVKLNTTMEVHLSMMLAELQLISGSGGMDIDRRIPLLSLMPANPGGNEPPRIEREPKALESVSSCAPCRL